MEEKNENVVEETTQDTTQQTEETNKPNINEDGDYVVNLDKPIENETKEDNANDSGVVAEPENADTTEKQEEIQPEAETQETPVLEEITEESTEEEVAQVEEQIEEAVAEAEATGKPPKNFESAGNDT